MGNRTPLESSNLHSAAWENGVLEIAFKGKDGSVRAVWQYSAPKESYDGWMRRANHWTSNSRPLMAGKWT